MEIALLKDITLIFAVKAVSLFICNKIKIPEILGYIITGLIIGPHVTGAIGAVHEVEVMAEIGVVLLLFAVGLEFSLAHLIALKRPALLGGGIQVVTTSVLGVLGAFLLLKLNMPQSVAIGLMLAVSSTAIVLKMLGSKGDLDTPYGRISTAVLIFQDIVVIPMMLAIPILAGTGDTSPAGLALLMLKAVGIVAVVFYGARILVPKIMFHVASAQNRELFVIVTVLIGFIIALLTSWAGLSLALGAFLAGIVISESDYGHQALGNVLPFKDLFTGFFFVSVGMLIDPQIFMKYSTLIISASAAALFIKFALASGAVLVLGFKLRTAVLTGIALCQVGEFSFIMAKSASSTGLLTGEPYLITISVIVTTMAVSPFLLKAAPYLADKSLALPFSENLKKGRITEEEDADDSLEDHIIIIGYGISGKNLAMAAKKSNISYCIIELNPSTVKAEKEKGENIIYGDASQSEILRHAGIESARALVVTIPDPTGVRRIVDSARHDNPTIHITARSRYVSEVQSLKELGANEVIVEEFETSVEIFSRVLRKYMVDDAKIEEFKASVRGDGYRIFKEQTAGCPEGLNIPGVSMENIMVPVGSEISGRTIRELDLRFKYGVSLLAVKRGTEVIANPGSDTELQERDELLVLASRKSLNEFTIKINNRKSS